MNITATHPPGACTNCDRMRAALTNVRTETCARINNVACIALAEEAPCEQ